jgi:uncharacterized protein (TIGR03067 family)
VLQSGTRRGTTRRLTRGVLTMLSQRAAVWAVVLGCAVSSLVRADDATKVSGDLKKMQGTWVNAGDDGPQHRWVIDGKTVKAKVNDGDEYTCTLELNPKAEPLPTAEFTVTEGPGESVGKSAKGIYKFDGDRLIFCIALPGADSRPTEFKTVEQEAYLIELKPEK